MEQPMLDSINAAAEALQHLDDISNVDIATAPRETVWEDGKVKLYHFTRTTDAKIKTPILISYALVNRWEMMDLQPQRSLIRRLLDEGADVYLIDWGYASHIDRYKDMEDYILGNINDCVDFLRKRHQVEKINLLGVCQGGTMSLIYASLFKEKIKNLITLVTPVDFSEEHGVLFRWAKELDVNALVEGFNGIVPGDFLNIGFDLLKPMAKVQKFQNLHKVFKSKDSLMNFLRMEKWVADSPSQAGAAYGQFIKEMYQKNSLINNRFYLDDQLVSLKNIDMPLMTVVAKEDHIVPPNATLPLQDAVSSKDKELIKLPGGHIGVFVGGRSQKLLAPAIATWLLDRDK